MLVTSIGAKSLYTVIIWEYDLMDLYRYLWLHVDIYMEFGYLSIF